MKITSIEIENLKCNGCGSTIKKGLEKFQIIDQVNIDLDKSTVDIKFEGDQSHIKEFKMKLASMGYPEKGQNNTISVAKSYVSCAIGKVSNKL